MSEALKHVAVTVEYASREFPSYSHVIKYEAALKIVSELEQQVAHLPARRTEQPIKRVNPDFPGDGIPRFKSFGIIIETDEEFAERAGTQIQEVAE